MNRFLVVILEFIKQYHISVEFERHPFSEAFTITIKKSYIRVSRRINDWELASAKDDYWIFVFKGMLHELLSEEQKIIDSVNEIKNLNITIPITSSKIKLERGDSDNGNQTNR